MNATTVPPQIAVFAAAVRDALADLPVDEVDELTEGLEADLTEAYAEDLARELPDPADYAAELRGAAGLPTPQPQRGRLREIAGSVAELGHDLERSLRQSPAMARVLDFAISLRPAWWIVRGWAAYQTVAFFFGMWRTDVIPGDPLRLLALTVMVVGSVVVGLRHWPQWVRVPIWLGNAFAVLMTFYALANVPTSEDLELASADDGLTYAQEVVPEGVWAGGREVTNIFAYDATGAPVKGIQLFDQDGQPIATSTPGGNGCLGVTQEEIDLCATNGAWVPSTLETGARAWNVYPMQMAESSPEDPTTPLAGATPQDRPAPFIKVPAVLAAPTAADPPADAENSR